MKKYVVLILLLSLTSFGPQLITAQTWELVWSDEFDGTVLDPNKWSFQTGDGCPDLCGWGNNELQWYTSNNHTVSDGLLTIFAKQEASNGKNYTSSRLRSINKGDWTYGRLEIRAKLPQGKGLWPALWMLPTDPSIYGVWAASGEIDIMELVGDKPDEVLGTLHYGAEWPNNQFTQHKYTLDNGDFSDDFHVFAVEWEEGAIKWYVDDQLYGSLNNWSTTNGIFPAPFDVDFHLLMNVAVGGNLPGNPDASTVFPQTMVVDYVRVYENTSAGEMPDNGLLFDDMEHGDPSNNDWFTFDGGGGGITANDTDLPPSGGGSFSLTAAYPLGNGYIGGFGRTNRLNLANATHFNFWINPAAGQSYTLEMQFQDDDNGDDLIPAPSSNDDEFQFDCLVGANGPCAIAGGGWQLVSIPFTELFDDNSFHNGGNAIFDPIPTSEGGNGQLINVVITVVGDNTGINFDTDNWAFVDSSQVTALEDELPHSTSLISPAFPNPFQTTSRFDVHITRPQHLKVEIFDMLGRSMDVLFDGMLTGPLTKTFEVNGIDWPNGVYLYQVTGATLSHTKKIILMR